MQTQLYSFLFVWLLLLGKDPVSASFPKAQNVTWESLNFKTLLKWAPKPVNYSYTVEFSKQGEDKEKSPFCIQTDATECDLTTYLKDLKGRYTADVMSQQMRGQTTDLIEFPYTSSTQFIPYEDTIIGKPEFEIKVLEGERKIILNVKDIKTAFIGEKNQRMTISEIFKTDLKYKVTYRKATSTGKKEKDSDSSVIELTNMDKGESYCFTVQAYIPSRSTDKQLGELSHVQCSQAGDKSFFEVYSLKVIAGVIVCIIAIIIGAVVIVWILCKRRQKARSAAKEATPLKRSEV